MSLIHIVVGLGLILSDEMPQRNASEPRSLAVIHQQVRTQEKAVARSKTDEDKSKSIATLCSLFVEIGEHPDLPKSQTFQSLSVRLRSRLSGIEKRTIDELRRRKIAEPESMIEDSKAFRRSRYLASKGITIRHGTSRESASSGAQRSSAGESRSSSGSEGGEQSTGNTTGDGDAAGETVNGNAAPGGLPDFGWGLVDLIRKTIRPDYWAVSGGPGKAIYFGPSRAIVIHGSWTVQEDVAELLTAL